MEHSSESSPSPSTCTTASAAAPSSTHATAPASVIVIPLDVFLQAKASFHISKSKLASVLKATYDDIRSKHTCLSSNSYPKFPNSNKNTNYGGHSHHAHNSRRTMEQRPRIGIRELCREDMVRKDILSNLNKLSKSNVESIIRALRTSFYLDYLSHYISITWDMMFKQHDFQPLFVMVLNNIRTLLVNPSDTSQFDTMLSHKCRQFIDDKGWLPPVSILCTAPDYDEFCDYMKWKKKSQGMLKSVLILMNHELVPPNFEEVFENISDSLSDFRSTTEGRDVRTLECILESLLICTRTIPKSRRNISDEWISEWVSESDNWPKNAKFKMLDIKESL